MTTEISTQRASTGLALQTFDDAFRFAKVVAASEFAPKDFKGKPESCLLAIQHGSEVGLSPMQSLQSIAVINGRPCVWGDAAIALVKASRVCEFVYEFTDGDGDNLVATCQAKRRGYDKPTTVQFTVADAKKAGLWGKSGPWTQYPKRMLQMRARGFALRDAFPDVLKGLVTAEEAQDYPATEPAKEPVVVRPAGEPARLAAVKSASAEPPAIKPAATAESMAKARAYIQQADVGKLEAMRDEIERRLQDGYYTPSQADEIFSLISGKLDWLTSEDNGQEFAHESAQHEVRS